MNDLGGQPHAADRTNRPQRKAQRSLVVLSAGISEPSATRMLADRVTDRVSSLAGERQLELLGTTIELRSLASELAPALASNHFGPGLTGAIDTLSGADALIVATPVYKAGVSGLLKLFVDLLDNDLLIAKPVMLLATAGTARHALVVDHEMRALFAFMRTVITPTALFVDAEDWGDGDLQRRIERAARELVLLIESDLATSVRKESWPFYQHEFGSAVDCDLSIDVNSELMKLAAGGEAKPDAD